MPSASSSAAAPARAIRHILSTTAGAIASSSSSKSACRPSSYGPARAPPPPRHGLWPARRAASRVVPAQALRVRHGRQSRASPAARGPSGRPADLTVAILLIPRSDLPISVEPAAVSLEERGPLARLMIHPRIRMRLSGPRPALPPNASAGPPWSRRSSVVDREAIEAGAAGELADELALQFLPRRLALLAGGFQPPALGEFPFPESGCRPPLAGYDTHLVARLEQRQPAADSGFGRGVEDRRARRRTALPAVADAGQ